MNLTAHDCQSNLIICESQSKRCVFQINQQLFISKLQFIFLENGSVSCDLTKQNGFTNPISSGLLLKDISALLTPH